MTPLRILVAGMVAAVPRQGSAVWATLQYLLGFRQLGHEVLFVEPVRADQLEPAGARLATSANAAYFRAIAAEFDFADSAALWLAGGEETVGLPYPDLRQAAARCDVLINLSGLLAEPALTDRIPVRIYLDLDPAFTQLWHEVQGIDMGFDGHTHFGTIGQAIGRPDCPVPTCGREWITTPQPLVLAQWPLAGEVTRDALTTIANWRGYGSIKHGGIFYGQKAHSLRPLIDLPSLTSERFELALSIHPDERSDLEALHANGWGLLDPAAVADSPRAARAFIQGSKTEFGLAKSGYVASRCGWFSDRSICYLASGRPVIAQDTGFDSFLPVGEGLFSFTDADDVLAAIEAINGDYPRHRRAARAIAEDHFDSDRVLARLLAAIGADS